MLGTALIGALCWWRRWCRGAAIGPTGGCRRVAVTTVFRHMGPPSSVTSPTLQRAWNHSGFPATGGGIRTEQVQPHLEITALQHGSK